MEFLAVRRKWSEFLGLHESLVSSTYVGILVFRIRPFPTPATKKHTPDWIISTILEITSFQALAFV